MMIGVAVALLLFFLAASAFFSGTETGLLSVSHAKIRRLMNDGDRRAAAVQKFLDQPEDFIGTVLVGNNLCHVTLSALATWFFEGMVHDSSQAVLLTMIVVTPLFLVFGEILPKAFFRQRPHAGTLAVARLFECIDKCLKPAVKGILRITHLFVPQKPHEMEREALLLRRQEIQALVREGERLGVLEDDEKEMIESVFELSETLVKEVMVPRVSMAAIEDDMEYTEIISFVLERTFTRYPVYHETPDKIVGILHVADLLETEKLEPERLAKPIYLTDTMKVDDALEYLRREGRHMAIVVDEYGGTAGIVTIEDLLEEMIGEIEDEFDDAETKIVRIDTDRWLVHGMTDMDDVVDITGMNLDAGEVEAETIGGLVMEKLGRIPAVGESIVVGGFQLIVTASDERHVIRVELKRNRG